MARELVDICIPIHGALDYFKRCIESIEKNTSNYRLVLINDYSASGEMDEYLNEVQSRHKSALLIKTSRQHWFSRASNLLFRLVRTERALLLNSDCEVGPNWLDDLYNAFDEIVKSNSHREIGLVGSVHIPDASYAYAETREGAKKPALDYVTGHCLLFSMKSINRVAETRGTPGWVFDERDQSQIHIASDRILDWEMNRLGIATFVHFHANVQHKGGASWNYDLAKAFSVQLKDVDWYRGVD